MRVPAMLFVPRLGRELGTLSRGCAYPLGGSRGGMGDKPAMTDARAKMLPGGSAMGGGLRADQGASPLPGSRGAGLGAWPVDQPRGAAASESLGTEVRRRGLVIALLGVFLLVVMMDNTIVNVALRSIQEELGASNAQLQWSVDSCMLSYAAIMFPAGILADRYGRKRVLLAGLLIFAVASGFSAFASEPEQFIFWRAIMGCGGAVVPPATLSLIREIFPPGERAKAMGIWSAIGGSSAAFGPVIGGLLLEWFWWGSVFLINLPIVTVAGLLALWAVPESRARGHRPLDAAGIVLSILGTGSLVYGVIRGGETASWWAWGSAGMIAAGVVCLAVFVVFESRHPSPTIDVSLFRNRAFASGTLSVSLAFLTLTGGTYLLVFYSLLIRGDSALQFGLILMPVAIGSICAALGAGAMVRASQRGIH